MGRGRSHGALLVLFLMALVAGPWFLLSRGAGRGVPAERSDVRLLARERNEELADPLLVLPGPVALSPEPAAALGREAVGAPDGDERVLVEELAFDPLGPDEGLLQIRVIAIETGSPLAGVALRLEVQRGGVRLAGVLPSELVTNAQGRVDCRVPAGAECLFSTESPGGPKARPLRWRSRSVPAGEIRTVLLPLFASTDLVWHALAVDAGSGAPLADARVVLAQGDPVVVPSILLAVEAEPDGILRLDTNSGEGERSVRIEAPDHAARVLQIRAGHEQRSNALRVELPLVSALEVLVIDAQGTPQADLDLVVSCPRAALLAESEPNLRIHSGDPTWLARTSAAGRARVEGLPPRAALTITLGPEGKLYQTVIEPGPEPGRTASLRVELGSGRTLAGVTRRPDGEPCPHVPLWLLTARRGERYLDDSMRQRVFQRTVSDEQGRFRFEGVPTGTWFVGPEPEGGSAWMGRSTRLLFEQAAADERARGLASVAEEVTLHDDGPLPEFVLTCWSDLYLSGQVVGPEGEDFVFVRARGVDMHVTEMVTTGASFRLGPLVPGLYELTASGETGESSTVSAQAGTEGLVLRLEPRADAEPDSR